VDIMKELEKFLLSEVDIDFDKKSIAPDEDLLSTGTIDSMGILKLTAFIEKKYGIKVTDEDVVPENFRTLTCLQGFIESRLKKIS
jgi:acyl carrier protein